MRQNYTYFNLINLIFNKDSDLKLKKAELTYPNLNWNFEKEYAFNQKPCLNKAELSDSLK